MIFCRNCKNNVKGYRQGRNKMVNRQRRKCSEHSDTEEDKVAEFVQNYYCAASMIDRHNWYRQDSLDLEKQFRAMDWATKMEVSLLVISICDSWFLYKSGMGSQASLSTSYFFVKIASTWWKINLIILRILKKLLLSEFPGIPVFLSWFFPVE